MLSVNIYSEFTQRLVNEMVTDVTLGNLETQSNNLVDLSQVVHNFTPSSLTPSTKTIYNSISSAEKMRFLSDISQDQNKIDKSLSHELNDPFNLELTKSELGFYMEYYLCDKLRCPYCNSKLLKFFKQNMPMVDLICANAKHHVESKLCCLWQVKTTVASDNYFNLTSKIISIPYNSYSQIVINPVEEYRHLQIGFICIYLNESSDGYRYNINYEKSFILRPKINSFRCYREMNNDRRKMFITWNDECFNDPKNIPNIGIGINTNEVYYDTDKIKNPLDESVGKLSMLF